MWITWTGERTMVERARKCDRASVRGFCFPGCILLSLWKQAGSLAFGEFLGPQGEGAGAAEGHKPNFSQYCLFLRVRFCWLCSCRHLLGAMVSWKLPGPTRNGLGNTGVGAQLLHPYHPSEIFALIPKLASEQDAPGAIGSCGSVTRLFLLPATPDLCPRKRVAWAAEGHNKPELLTQHWGSATSPSTVCLLSEVEWCQTAA